MLAQPARRRSGFMNFDLTRFTPIGWVVFLFSFVLTFVAAIYLASCWDSMFPPTKNMQSSKGNPGIWVGIGVGIGFFFAVLGILRLVGVKLIRPKPPEPDERPRRRSASRREETAADRKPPRANAEPDHTPPG